MRVRSDFLVVLGFGAALLAPALAWRADPRAWIDLQRENRLPAPFPVPGEHPGELRGFPQAFEAWQADTLGLRAPLLRLGNLLELRGWRKAPTDTLLLGREDWLFYTGENSREIWRGLYPIPNEFASNWAAALRSRAAWFARRGIAYLYVVAPNKETLYPDKLPEGEQALGPTLLDELQHELDRHPGLPLCDLRAALSAEREHDRPEAGDFVYHPIGTHWTARAGWRVAREITRRLCELYPDLRPAPGPARAECRLEELPGSLEDTWAISLRLEDVVRQRVYDFLPLHPQAESCTAGSEELNLHETLFERRDGAGESVVLVHDSFGPWLRGPLAEHCARLHAMWEDELPLERILADAPRVVIELRSERRLQDSPVWLYDSLESLAQSEFALLPRLEPLPALPGSIEGIASYAGSRIQRDEAGVRVLSRAGGARVLLAGWKPGPGGRLAIGLVLQSPVATQASLWYQTNDEPEFHPRRRNVLQVAAGRNELWLRLPEAGIRGPLLFQPGELPGDYVIERFEGRSGVR